ncbi:MAG: hypothetical protein K2Q18_00625 [Bdellovibrionales bacterium]|nr:hypothetical protein [Bdellovibrionales bacterium]
MKVKIIIGNKEVIAIMHDNPSSRDFISLMPLNLKLKDYNSTEKIADLPKKLSLKEAPAGSDPLIGDIAYYSPWGNLAIFYKDDKYADGLVRLGKIVSGLEILKSNDSFNARIELINE